MFYIPYASIWLNLLAHTHTSNGYPIHICNYGDELLMLSLDYMLTYRSMFLQLQSASRGLVLKFRLVLGNYLLALSFWHKLELSKPNYVELSAFEFSIASYSNIQIQPLCFFPVTKVKDFSYRYVAT